MKLNSFHQEVGHKMTTGTEETSHGTWVMPFIPYSIPDHVAIFLDQRPKLQGLKTIWETIPIVVGNLNVQLAIQITLSMYWAIQIL